jgi:hypothetical protein
LQHTFCCCSTCSAIKSCLVSSCNVLLLAALAAQLSTLCVCCCLLQLKQHMRCGFPNTVIAEH